MIAMLALPEDETEEFIEAKAAAGTPVEARQEATSTVARLSCRQSCRNSQYRFARVLNYNAQHAHYEDLLMILFCKIRRCQFGRLSI